MSRPRFKIWAFVLKISDYLDKMGVEDHADWMLTLTDDREISAEELNKIARFVLIHAREDKIADLASFYGVDLDREDSYREMVGHVADEILSDCCVALFEI